MCMCVSFFTQSQRGSLVQIVQSSTHLADSQSSISHELAETNPSPSTSADAVDGGCAASDVAGVNSITNA